MDRRVCVLINLILGLILGTVGLFVNPVVFQMHSDVKVSVNKCDDFIMRRFVVKESCFVSSSPASFSHLSLKPQTPYPNPKPPSPNPNPQTLEDFGY